MRLTVMRLLLALAAIFAVLSGIQAQDNRPSSGTIKGNGTFTLNSSNYEIDEVTVDLRGGGEAIVTLRGDQTWRLRGRWTGPTATQVSIYLNEGDIPRLNVTGYAFRANGSLTGLQFSGTSEYGRTVANFKSASGGGGSTDRTETFRGRGYYTIRDDRTSLNSCTVTLSRDNRFSLALKSDVARVEFVGTYRLSRHGDYELTMSGSVNGTRGEGTITLVRDRFDSVRLDGRKGRNTWQLRFDRR